MSFNCSRAAAPCSPALSLLTHLLPASHEVFQIPASPAQPGLTAWDRPRLASADPSNGPAQVRGLAGVVQVGRFGLIGRGLPFLVFRLSRLAALRRVRRRRARLVPTVLASRGTASRRLGRGASRTTILRPAYRHRRSMSSLTSPSPVVIRPTRSACQSPGRCRRDPSFHPRRLCRRRRLLRRRAYFVRRRRCLTCWPSVRRPACRRRFDHRHQCPANRILACYDWAMRASSFLASFSSGVFPGVFSRAGFLPSGSASPVCRHLPGRPPTGPYPVGRRRLEHLVAAGRRGASGRPAAKSDSPFDFAP